MSFFNLLKGEDATKWVRHCDKTGAWLRQSGCAVTTKRVLDRHCDKTGAPPEGVTKWVRLAL